MEKFYFSEELQDSLSEDKFNYAVSEPKRESGVVFDAALMRETVSKNELLAARRLTVMQVTDIEKTPEHIVACYNFEQGIITKQKFVKLGSYVIYYEISPYVNLTGKNAAAAFIAAARKNAAGRNFYAVDNSVFPNFPVWSAAISKAYSEKFGEDVTEKLLMLFVGAAGSERFRVRYYSLIGELIKENFLTEIKNICREDRVPFLGFAQCSTAALAQILPNNCMLGFGEIYDKLFISIPKEYRRNEFIRKYLKLFIGINRKKTVAKISYEDFCILSLPELKFFADRILASGIKQICFESGAQNEVLRKKREIIENYVTKVGCALSLGKKQTDCLVVYPASTLAGEYAIGDDSAAKTHIAAMEEQIADLNTAHVLYEIASENDFGGNIKISGALLSAAGSTYTGLILLSHSNISPKMAGFIIKFAENGGRVYSLGDLPQKIDGFKSQKIGDVTDVIRPLKKGELAVLRRSLNPVFGDSEIDLLSAALDKGRMLYFAANIKENSGKAAFTCFEDIVRLDTVSFTEKPCTLSNKIGKVMGKQIIELNRSYSGSAIFITGKAKNAENLEEVTENLQLSPYFDITKCDNNTLVLNKCNFSAGYRFLHNTTLFDAVEKIVLKHKVNEARFVFPFTVTKLAENMTLSLYFKNQEKCSVKVNSQPVFMQKGEPADITELVTEGENIVTVIIPKCSEEYAKDKTFISNMLLRGNFAVLAKDTVRTEEDCVITHNNFEIAPENQAISLERVLESGYWFFSGCMELSQKFSVIKTFGARYLLEFKRFGGMAMDITLNGKRAGDIAMPPYSLDITDLLENGENEIKIILYANQSNLRLLSAETEENVSFEPLGAKILAKKDEAAFITVSEVWKTYGGEPVLSGVEFSVKKGEFAVIYGDAGSGKTTLINILGGIERANGGTVTVNDIKINKLGELAISAFRRKDVAFIFPQDNLIEGYSVADNILLACEQRSQVLDMALILRSVGMFGRENEKVSKLTHFEMQKVAIARALAKNPKIIICDEPIFGLTPAESREILHLLKETCKLTEKTVIIATENGAVCDIADRVIRLKAGKIADESVNSMPTEIERIEF